MVMGDKVPQELRKERLDHYRMGLLKELKELLWHKMVKGREEKGRAKRTRARAEAEARRPKQLALGL